LKFIFQNH